MFLAKFIVETDIWFWIWMVALCVCSILIVKIRTLLGPVGLGVLYLILSVSWATSFISVSDVIWLLLLFFLVLFSIRWGSSLNLSPQLSQVRGEEDIGRLMYWLLVGLLTVSLCYLVVLFSQEGYSKLSWTPEHRYFNYFLNFLLSSVLAFSFYFMLRNQLFFFYASAFFVLCYGLIVGAKGSLVAIGILYIVYYTSQRRSIKFSDLFFSKILLIILLISFIILVLFFGKNPLVPFLSRFAATVDGLFILKTSELYPNFEFEHSVWRYIFDVIFSKLDGPIESVGQALASKSKYLAYPPYGGPNDSMVIYFLVSDYPQKISLLALSSLISLLFGIIDSIMKNNTRKMSIVTVIAVLPLYLKLPGFYQGVGTFFLLLARSYLFLIPFIFFLIAVLGSCDRGKR